MGEVNNLKISKNWKEETKEAKPKRKGMNKKENMTIWAKKVGHNRGPPEQSYYWGSRWLMDYPLEKLFGCNVLMVF